MTYVSGFGFPADVMFDMDRVRRLLANKWFFAGTRGDVAQARDYFTFSVLGDEFMLIHGTDGQIRCFVNRCAHQSAQLVKGNTGTTPASLVCPNHQWTYNINTGALRTAAMMGPDFADTDFAKQAGLTEIPLQEVAGMLFACLNPNPDRSDLNDISNVVAPYTDPYAMQEGGYKLAHHHREVVPANWLNIMINNRECCHCRRNHKGLLTLFDPSSFNGTTTDAYNQLMDNCIKRWEADGRAWAEQAFTPNDCCRIARYPLSEGHKSITFDGAAASTRLIGGWDRHDPSTLSIWLNPNAWIHFTSDHIATNWVLPQSATTSTLYSSWIVHQDAVEDVDYKVDHLTEVWKVTNAEDVELCNTMTRGAQSTYYQPGPFANDEQFCTQYCDWYMRHSG